MVIGGLIVIRPYLPLLGRPALIIGMDQIDIAGYGVIPWTEIEGVHLLMSRRSHAMSFRVPRLGVASVVMQWPSERPAVVEIVCKNVWTVRTGKDSLWSPTRSDEMNAAYDAQLAAARRELDLPRKGVAPRSFVDHTLTPEECNAEMRRKATAANFPELVSVIDQVEESRNAAVRRMQLSNERSLRALMWTLIVMIVLASVGGAFVLWLNEYSRVGA
jgi:hypothetical protein